MSLMESVASLKAQVAGLAILAALQAGVALNDPVGWLAVLVLVVVMGIRLGFALSELREARRSVEKLRGLRSPGGLVGEA